MTGASELVPAHVLCQQQGLDRARLKAALDAGDNWGAMTHAFEFLTAVAAVVASWPEDGPRCPTCGKLIDFTDPADVGCKDCSFGYRLSTSQHGGEAVTCATCNDKGWAWEQESRIYADVKPPRTGVEEFTKVRCPSCRNPMNRELREVK